MPSDGPVQIATLKAKSGPVAVGPVILLVLGSVLILFEVLLDNSAVRLAAFGAIWTGWNVLWGICVLHSRRTEYIVYRDIQETGGR